MHRRCTSIYVQPLGAQYFLSDNVDEVLDLTHRLPAGVTLQAMSECHGVSPVPRIISQDRILLYEYARYIHPDFFMVSEACRQVGIREGSAARHALDFEELGIFESRGLRPEQMFKIRPNQYLERIDLVRRLEEALPIMRKQRATLAQRAAEAEKRMQSWPGAGKSSPRFNKESGRQQNDPGSRE